MYYLKLKDNIEKAIRFRPFEIELYNDLFDRCRENEKIDFAVAYEWNHTIRNKAAYASGAGGTANRKGAGKTVPPTC